MTVLGGYVICVMDDVGGFASETRKESDVGLGGVGVNVFSSVTREEEVERITMMIL